MHLFYYFVSLKINVFFIKIKIEIYMHWFLCYVKWNIKNRRDAFDKSDKP